MKEDQSPFLKTVSVPEPLQQVSVALANAKLFKKKEPKRSQAKLPNRKYPG